MTREEVTIQALRNHIEALSFDFELYKAGLMEMPNGVIDILDKIRAEIEQKRIGYPPSAEYYWAIKECLQIIDKYKAEMESEK